MGTTMKNRTTFAEKCVSRIKTVFDEFHLEWVEDREDPTYTVLVPKVDIIGRVETYEDMAIIVFENDNEYKRFERWDYDSVDDHISAIERDIRRRLGGSGPGL